MADLDDTEIDLYASTSTDESIAARMAREIRRHRARRAADKEHRSHVSASDRTDFDVVDLPRLQTGNLIAYLGTLRAQMAELAGDAFAAQSIAVRIAEVQREIAIRNARGLTALGDFPALPVGIEPKPMSLEDIAEVARRHEFFRVGDIDAVMCIRLLGHIACLVAGQRQAIADACAQVAAAAARELDRMRQRVAEPQPGWRAGIEASIRRLEAQACKPRDLWHAAYFAALDEALVHLRAMLVRGTERAGDTVASEPQPVGLGRPAPPASRFGLRSKLEALLSVFRDVPGVARYSVLSQDGRMTVSLQSPDEDGRDGVFRLVEDLGMPAPELRGSEHYTWLQANAYDYMPGVTLSITGDWQRRETA